MKHLRSLFNCFLLLLTLILDAKWYAMQRSTKPFGLCEFFIESFGLQNSRLEQNYTFRSGG